MSKKNIRQAVSVILRCDEKLFIIKRQNYLRAFPGYSAFPGGKRDAQDNSLVDTAKREIFEELGLKINTGLKEIAKATSPSFNPVRFETTFFLVDLSDFPDLKVDTNEAMEFGWYTPLEILDEYKDGLRLLVTPIRLIIEKLLKKEESFTDFDELRNKDLKVPFIETIYGLKQIMPLSNTVPPAQRTNSFLFGNDRKTLVDPSPKNNEEYEAFKTSVLDQSINKIFITHHHGDHHQYAPKLAKELGAEIFISKDSKSRIENKKEDYFSGVIVHEVKEGDIIGTWQGEDVYTMAIPGHDEGHMAIYPESKKWMIVGDLFQGIGTVVVGGEEGDMIKYFNSLKKVIEFSPRCVIPSHGIALGGTSILEKTLEHRKIREEQVLELSLSGKNIDEILSIIYFNIPSEVLKYARANIVSHLKKLQFEGRLP